MSTIVKAADAAQFLSLVPLLLGYTPTESLVLVPMRQGRSLGGMRIDLPPGGAPPDGLASSAVGMLCRVGAAEAFVAVVYTAASARHGLPGADLVAALRASGKACGLPLVDGLTVAGDGWGSHDDPHLPPGGRDIAALVRELPPEAGDQASGAVLPEVDAAVRAGVVAATASLRTALEVVCGIPSTHERLARVDPAALEAACTLDDLPVLYEDALDWDAASLDPMRTAVIAWCLGRPALRDVGIVQWATDLFGGEEALDAQLTWEHGGDYPPDIACVMWGEGPRPDAERLEAALRLARHVAAALPTDGRAGPLATAAWLSWALGRSTHAEEYARAAQDADPDHGLAEIVRSFVAAAHLPDWAFRRA